MTALRRLREGEYGLFQMVIACYVWRWPHPVAGRPSPIFEHLYQWFDHRYLAFVLAAAGAAQLLSLLPQFNARRGLAIAPLASCFVFGEIALSAMLVNPRGLGLPLFLFLTYQASKSYVRMSGRLRNGDDDRRLQLPASLMLMVPITVGVPVAGAAAAPAGTPPWAQIFLGMIGPVALKVWDLVMAERSRRRAKAEADHEELIRLRQQMADRVKD